MAFDTFSPTRGPSLPVAHENTPDIRSINFQDGYRQEAGRDINKEDTAATLRWENLTQTEYDEIKLFNENHVAPTRFRYQIPGDSAVKTWIIRRSRYEKTNADVLNIEWQLERRFDVAP